MEPKQGPKVLAQGTAQVAQPNQSHRLVLKLLRVLHQ
jgi:hypothetical protein